MAMGDLLFDIGELLLTQFERKTGRLAFGLLLLNFRFVLTDHSLASKSPVDVDRSFCRRDFFLGFLESEICGGDLQLPDQAARRQPLAGSQIKFAFSEFFFGNKDQALEDFELLLIQPLFKLAQRPLGICEIGIRLNQ